MKRLLRTFIIKMNSSVAWIFIKNVFKGYTALEYNISCNIAKLILVIKIVFVSILLKAVNFQ